MFYFNFTFSLFYDRYEYMISSVISAEENIFPISKTDNLVQTYLLEYLELKKSEYIKSFLIHHALISKEDFDKRANGEFILVEKRKT
jgi:hypothetical protein